MRTIKKNVWKPFLFGCIGLVIATVVFASVRNPFDPPGKPGTPEIWDWSRHSCDIKFLAPKDDGGSPITQYIVEGREEWSPYWEIKGSYDGGGLEVITCTIRSLTEGTTIKFRARAVNKAGAGEPSEPSYFVTIKDR